VTQVPEKRGMWLLLVEGKGMNAIVGKQGAQTPGETIFFLNRGQGDLRERELITDFFGETPYR